MTRTYGGIQTHRLGFLKSIMVHDIHLDVHTAEKTKEKRINIETQHDFNNSTILIIKKKFEYDDHISENFVQNNKRAKEKEKRKKGK